MKNYDPMKESRRILYLDANILCGCAMQQKLLIGNHEWENSSLFTKECVNKVDEKEQTGLY